MSMVSGDKINFPARILLVDDDSVLRREFIEAFEDFPIAEAPGGEEAIRILKKPNEIDLVILDLRMPGMNGIEVLDKIKQIAPDVRVVIFTAYGSKDVAVEALRSRADDYLEKPIDIEAAKEIVEKHLRASDKEKYGPGAQDKVAHAKDFLLKNFHKKVTLNDVADAVCLSPKYLSRIFREHAKKGFNDFKLSLRIEQAKKILEQTGFTIEQISGQLGYLNPESFIRQFKLRAGSTPTEYRKSLKVRKRKKNSR